MVSPKQPLSVARQCQLLDLPRSTYYYRPKPVPEADLELMRKIDECHLERPFDGSRRLKDWLELLGYAVSRKKVQRLMREMGLTALYPKRNLSKRNQAHKVYPYLLGHRPA
jgi:putative transposase